MWKIALLACALVATACQDVRSFAGSWSGRASVDPHLSAGFPSAQASLDIAVASELDLHGALTLAPLFESAPVDSIRGASGDALGGLRVGHDPLHSYFAFATPTDGSLPALAVISLFGDDRVELRIVRGTNELYGLFSLRRAP
jgi:hypothetical protein